MTTYSVRCRNYKCRHRRVTIIHPDEYKRVPACPVCGRRAGWRIEQRAYSKRNLCYCSGPEVTQVDGKMFPHKLAKHQFCDHHPHGFYNQARAKGVAHEDIPEEHRPMDLTPKEAAYSPEEAQTEMMQLLVKAARRCAYDLRHAADDAKDNGPLWHQRAAMWIGIFNPGQGLKDYRHRLHTTIAQQDSTIEGLRALCRKHGIEMGELDEPPF